MNLDRMLYLVISEHPFRGGHRGPIIYEIEIDNMARDTVIKDLRGGQYGRDWIAVIELNPAERICREVTDEFRALARTEDD